MNRPGTSISKAKVTKSSTDEVGLKKVAQEKLPTLQDYLTNRDWIGAIALLENERNVNIHVENSMWLAYCYFHMGEYRYIQLYAGKPFKFISSCFAETPIIKIITFSKHAAITLFASTTTPKDRHSRETKLRCRSGCSSIWPTRRMTKKL